MFGLHTHKWVLIDKTAYRSGLQQALWKNKWFQAKELCQDLLCGKAVYVFQCTVCSKLKIIEVRTA